MRPYSPGGALNALAATPNPSIGPASSAHRLRRGLPGYLILFAPHAFADECQNWPSEPPSPPVFFLISTHSTATPGIPLASTSNSVIPNNACTLRLTAAAGTELAGASFGGTVSRPGYLPVRDSSPPTVVYTPKGFLPHAASLRQSFDHCAIFPTAASRRSLGRISVPM